MNTCLTDEQIALYRRGALEPPEAMVAADRHLAECERCRKALRDSIADAAPDLARDLAPAPEERDCPDDALFVRYVDREADDTDREIVETHVQLCHACAEDVAALRALKAELHGTAPWQQHGATVRQTGQTPWPLRFRAALNSLGVAAVVLLICLLGPIRSLELDARAAEKTAQHLNQSLEPIRSYLLSGGTANLFDDVKVYAGSRVWLSEGFDRYEDGQRTIPTLLVLQPGSDGFLVNGLEGLGARGGCWASFSMPGSAREDGVRLSNDDIVRAGGVLTYEARVYLPDARKGVFLGLVRNIMAPPNRENPDQRVPSVQMTAAVVLRDGWIDIVHEQYGAAAPAPHGFRGLAPIQSRRWYAVRVDCDLHNHTMDVYLDGQSIGRNLKMQDRKEFPATHYEFDAFGFGGVNFPADAPPP